MVKQDGLAAEVLRLCTAVRQAQTLLTLGEREQVRLLASVTLAEHAARACPVDRAGVEEHVRAMRYILVELADGPIAAFLADAAARIAGDGIGKLFS